MPQVIHESLNLPGYWRLCSFGKLEAVPARKAMPRVQAYLKSMGNKPSFDTNNEGGEWVVRKIPLGEIPRLYLNAVLKDGRVLSSARSPWDFEHPASLHLDFSRPNLIVISRFKKDRSGNLIIPDKHGRLRDDWDGESLFVGIGANGDRFAYIIPCAEILRFFYTTSSVFIGALFSGGFLEPDRYLWDTDLSRRFDDGRAFIQMRLRMRDSDARFIARFAFDAYALERICEIFTYTAGHRHKRGERILRALPPLQGPTSLNVIGVPIQSGGRQRLLVTRIRTCDWGAPYTELVHDRDNDGRRLNKDRDKKPKAQWPGKRVPVPGIPPNEVTLTDDPPSTNLQPWELNEEEIDERFPELAKIPVRKAPQTNTKTAGAEKAIRLLKRAGDKASTDIPKSSGEHIAQALIKGMERAPPPIPEVTEDIDPGNENASYRITLGLLHAIRDAGVARVDFIAASDQVAHVDDAILSVFPPTVNDWPYAWLYMDKEHTRRRMALVASIENDGRVRYVIDIQHKQPNECCILVVWAEDEGKMPTLLLREALFACAKAKGAALETATHLNLRWNRRKHSAKKVDEEEAQRLLKKIFTTKTVFSNTTKEET